ncbi:MAG: response regulator [candidate division Zixibacteria bacterium]|nr:response regulator [candidate division Zixibacteria bacterium]
MDSKHNNTDNSSRSRLLVLIVDDDHDLIADMQLLLAPHFEIVSSVRSGLGMQILLRHHPDCVLLDINMEQYFGSDKRLEGLAFLKELRTNIDDVSIKNTPVILISSSEIITEESRIEHSANAFFQKPVDIITLVKKIEVLCTKKNNSSQNI